jgi:hypothetical protein
MTESPLEIRVARQVELPTSQASPVRIYPELDRYREIRAPGRPDPGAHAGDAPYRLTTQDLPPPTPSWSGTSSQVSGFSGSPSTRFSESPGGGPYSRDTTPTSISSYSPGLVAPMRIPTARLRQGSPSQTRPPVSSRMRSGSNAREADALATAPAGLPAVRESLTSSSSNSTVRNNGEKDARKKKKVLAQTAPNPPPRKSSQKFKKPAEEKSSTAGRSQAGKERERAVASPPAPAPAPAPGPAPGSGHRRVDSDAALSPRPPTRPSRDGTPDLQSQLGLPLPIVHSNLSSSSLTERRQSVTLGPSAMSRSATPSASAPTSNRAAPQASSRIPPGREPTPIQTNAKSPEPARVLRTPSPSVSGFKSRFPMFSRRAKTTTAEVLPQAESQEKVARKGPAAGTGHEGYGRIGAVRRRSSGILARGIAGTMSSQESLAGQDAFFAERTQPVVISGGEIVENRNTSSELSRTESNFSLPASRPSLDSRNGSQASLPMTMGSSIGRRRPSDSSDSEGLAMKSTLAFRRSVLKASSRTDPSSAARLPKPIMTQRPGVISPPVNSLDASLMSDDSTMLNRGRPQAAGAAPKKLVKREKSPRKWNLFGRSQSKAKDAKTVAATVSVVPARPVAFYTMMDSSEQEDGEPLRVEDVLRDAEAMPATSQATTMEPLPSSRPRRQSLTNASRPRAGSRGGEGGTTPVSSKPQDGSSQQKAVAGGQPSFLPSSSGQMQMQQPSTANNGGETSRPRPSRLAQVGRIPKVVSARAEPPSPRSFSRPFNRASMQMPAPAPARARAPASAPAPAESEWMAKGPSPPKPCSTPELTQDGGSTMTGGTVESTSRNRLSKDFTLLDLGSNLHSRVGTKEFLAFSPRHSSLITTTTTTTTTSSGSGSGSGSGLPAFVDATAVVPEANAPLVDDEIWDEYNDLLGDESLRVPPSAGSSQGTPFHLEMYGSRLKKQSVPPLESPTISTHRANKTNANNTTTSMDGAVAAAAGKTPVTSGVYSVDMTTKLGQLEALDDAANPTTPFSLSEFVSGYEDRHHSSTAVKEDERKNEAGKTARASRASDSSQSSSDDNSPLSQVNLRVGSMTVSKWLTFGHVLFSPVREELIPTVGSLKRHSILVVDGLGNDDWSFYAAETYPAATFFNLSPRAPLPEDHRTAATFPISPPNHHQIQYLSHSDKFPFGPQSFTSVVYRFPAAGPESHYRNVISEARRVLKPGGYIELSMLDVDLNNMGNRCRRTIRQLKERIHRNAPDTSLSPTADLMLRLLGRRGFLDLKTCRVGVPVASVMHKSSSGSEAGSGPEVAVRGAAAAAVAPSPAPSSGAGIKRAPIITKVSRPRKDDRSLAEMMNDESPVADESITKMVAKVGRWWYNKCYESAALSEHPAAGGGAPSPTTRSIWAEPALLAECEEWGTSFKLMVCHARLPDGRTRVASV